MSEEDEATPIALDDDDDDDEDEDYHGCCFRCLTKLGCSRVAQLPYNMPRICGLMLGVVFPLFSLIFVSLLFGNFLATLESPLEIVANNNVIASRTALGYSASFMNNVTEQSPRICTALYFANGTKQQMDEEIWIGIEETFATGQQHASSNDPSNRPSIQEVNVTDLLEFMDKCGGRALEYARNVNFTNDTSSLTLEIGGLTFDWTRCDGRDIYNSSGSGGVLKNIWNPYSEIDLLRPGVQEQYAIGQWNEQQQDLYDEYLPLYLEAGMRQFEARNNALWRSFDEASGFDDCRVNTPGGAWFWFTIMTTIGYGNTAPQTEGGQAMVYTLGFFSILLFAVVLAQSATIATAICDDWVDRVHLSHLRIPWAGCIYWGSLYYLWMLIIARYTQSWKEYRLEEEFLLGTAYWFSFISTTTVGLGDYYLEHALLLPADVFVFSLLFLFGFVLLSNFLVKLSELVTGFFPSRGPSFEELLKKTNVPCCPCCPALHKCKRKGYARESLMDQEESAAVSDMANGVEARENVSTDTGSKVAGEGSKVSAIESAGRNAEKDACMVQKRADADVLSKSASIKVEDGWSGLLSTVPSDIQDTGEEVAQ